MLNRKWPDYKENKSYYKNLIKDFNESVDFTKVLSHLGYKMTSKSASYREFRKGQEQIVVNISSYPMRYFDRNSDEKGWPFSFVNKRAENFFKAFEDALELANITHLADGPELVKDQTKKAGSSLEDKYNIESFTNAKYLVQDRCISPYTLESEPFRGRILNAVHKRYKNGSIKNIAFPKYDVDGTIKNYVLRNAPFINKETGKLEKFRPVLNNRDEYLYYSNIPKNGVNKIVFSESEIDLLSFYELKPDDNALYVSFGGNIYAKKIDQFLSLIEVARSGSIENLELVSITDNDAAGFKYDISCIASITNALEKNVNVEYSLNRGLLEYKMLFENGDTESYNRYNALKTVLNDDDVKVVNAKNWISIEYRFALPDKDGKFRLRMNDTSSRIIEQLSTPVTGLYMYQSKPLNGDWNEELMRKKQYENFNIDIVKRPGDVRNGRYVEFQREQDRLITKGIVVEKEPSSAKVRTEGGAVISVPLDKIFKYGIKRDNNYKFKDGYYVSNENRISKENNINEIEL